MELNDRDILLVTELSAGLELCERPYDQLGRRVGMAEDEVIARIGAMAQAGIIRRLGVVVRHHELGFRANAMAVWDIPDDRVAAIGTALAAEPAVTLCYRRPRRPPHWPYTLFCMVHGRARAQVLAAIADINARHGLAAFGHDVLFSTRRFKQCGARYGRAAEVRHG